MVIKIRLNKWLHIWNNLKSVIFNFISENNFSAISSQEGQKQGIRAIKCLGNARTAKKLLKLKPLVQDLYWFPTEFQLLHLGFWPAHQNFTQWQAFCFLFNIILNTKSRNYLFSRRGSALVSAVHCCFLWNSSTGRWSSVGVVLSDQPG